MSSSLRKMKYIKLEKMAPSSRDQNIVVNVVQKRTVVDKIAPNGNKMLVEEVLVADETGCMFLTARNENCDLLQVGETVVLCNAKVTMIKNTMRLGFDKWGSIKDTTVLIPGEIQLEPNFSKIVYELMAR